MTEWSCREVAMCGEDEIGAGEWEGICERREEKPGGFAEISIGDWLIAIA